MYNWKARFQNGLYLGQALLYNSRKLQRMMPIFLQKNQIVMASEKTVDFTLLLQIKLCGRSAGCIAHGIDVNLERSRSWSTNTVDINTRHKFQESDSAAVSNICLFAQNAPSKVSV